MIFNHESVRGVYRVSASYIGQVDKNIDVTFEVIQKEFDSSTLKSKPMPQSLENSHSQNETKIPNWIKNNAKWWADGQIGDQAFVLGIQYLIEQKIVQIPNLQTNSSQNFGGMPIWVKNIAGFWAEDTISDEEFIKSIQYLVGNGIIVVS